MENMLYYLWLNLRLGAGSRAAVRLVRAAGGARAVYEDLSDEIVEMSKVKPSVIDRLRRGRDLTECEEIVAKCDKWHVRILTPNMKEYPKSLLCTMDYPMILFCKGAIPDFNSRFFCAVVGTRDMSDYGRRAAYDIGLGLGDGGAVTVSGLALGIDSMAMAGALAAGGSTVGVLGCGIDIVYPPAHKDLFDMVTENGAIITEYIPGAPPAGSHFPVRNRIISGLCQATAVIEADSTSGALITAKHAIFQGREIFALPGNVGEKNSEGPNRLIRDGASVILDANDIISKYEFLYPHSLKPARVVMGGADTSALAVSNVSRPTEPKKKNYGEGVFGGDDAVGKRKGRGTSPSRKKTGANAEELPPPKAPSFASGGPADSPSFASGSPAPIPSFADATAGGRGAKIPPIIRATSQSEDEVLAAEYLAEQKVSRMRFCHIDMLGKKEQDVYYAMKPGTPTLPEEILQGVYPIGDILAAMTILEISGAVEAGAGGYFIRCDSADDGLVEENN